MPKQKNRQKSMRQLNYEARKADSIPGAVERKIEREVYHASLRHNERVEELWEETYGDLEFDGENETHQEWRAWLSERVAEEERRGAGAAHGSQNWVRPSVRGRACTPILRAAARTLTVGPTAF
jgi:hypothetical protein